MQTPYRIEFFDRYTYQLDGWSVCEEPPVTFDYLTLQAYSVVGVGTLSPDEGDYVQIMHGNEIHAQGLLASYDTAKDKSKTTYSIKPLTALLDFSFVPSYIDLPLSSELIVENLLKEIITWGRRDNPDASARLPGLVINTQTATTAVSPLDDKTIQSAWTVASECLKQHRVAITASLDIPAQQILFNIARNDSESFIEADLPNIIDKTFSLATLKGNVTAVLVINSADTTQYTWVYAGGDRNGTWQVQEISLSEGETFAEKAQTEADKILTPSNLKNTIEIIVKRDDNLVTQNSIGELVNIRHANKIYPAILTGISYSKDLKTLTFGESRFDLTQILQLQNRRENT